MGDFVLIVVILIVVYFIVVLLQKLLGSVQNKIEPDNKSEIDLYLIDNELEQSKFSQYLNSNQDVTIKYQRKFMLQESFNNIKDLSNWEVAIYKCHVKNGDYVNEGDIIYSLKVQKIGKDWWKTFDVKCLKSGYIEIISDVIGDSSDLISSSNCLKEFDVLYKIYNSNTDDLFANYYSECEPIITVDNFLNTKDIKWKKIAGQSDKISYSDGFEFDNDLADCLNLSSSGHKKSLLYFTLNCIENKDFIIFKTINKYLKLNKGDVIHFLFDDNSKINFEINKCVYNNINCDGDKLFESNIQITSGELEKLANHTLIN